MIYAFSAICCDNGPDKDSIENNSPLFCLSVIYIQKSLKKKIVFAVTTNISDLNTTFF
jgi:hypothetical protein